ncbi:MAG: septum site-determining protein MinC [Lachnospiraceae bacterium]|nr:septum site-determining protein MinC [Lachnospiraceae bacterium]
MAEKIKLKLFNNGLSVYVDESMTFEEIIEKVSAKFSENRNFFGKKNLALSIEGCTLSDREELSLIEAIQSNSGLKIICVIGKDEDTDKSFIKALSHVEKRINTDNDENTCEFYRGTLRDGEVVDTDKSIVILGDVYPDCVVRSSGDIIVLGGLYGEAYAGCEGDDTAFCMALEMQPERLKIGDFLLVNEKPSKWSFKLKVSPKLAYVKGQKVVLENVSKELFESIADV